VCIRYDGNNVLRKFHQSSDLPNFAQVYVVKYNILKIVGVGRTFTSGVNNGFFPRVANDFASGVQNGEILFYPLETMKNLFMLKIW